MSTDTDATVKSKRKSPWADLTPEQKAAKLKAMNDAKAAKGKAPSNTAELEAAKAEVLELRRQLEEKTRTAQLSPSIEMYYEFSRSPKKGTERITDLNDPRWEELDDFRRDCFGTFVIRQKNFGPTGEITGVSDLTCLSRRPRPAREMMERYLATGDHVQRLTEVVR